MNRAGPIRFLLLGFVLVAFVVASGGCHKPGPPPQGGPTKVLVSYPVEMDVTDYADYPGTIAAVESVEIRARVWGFLDKVNFKEGALVKKGDILYEIDPRTYLAAVNQSKAKVDTDEAQSRLAIAEYNRNVAASRSGAVSKEDVDKALANRDVAASNIVADKADLAAKQLDLDFTKVISPIDGRVSRTNVTVGNLVQSGQNGGTLLTTVVSVDPMYCYFEVDERTLLRVQKLIREGKAKSARDVPRPVMLGLSSEGTEFPHQGNIEFVDNQVNPKTGTLRLRGTFPNKKGLLTVGLFTRVRVPIGEPHKAVLIAERAIDTDQGQKIVYLIDENKKVFTRPITVGARHHGMIVVEEGVKPGELVIVEGLQRVRVDATVEPKEVPMPKGGASEERPEKAGTKKEEPSVKK